MAYKQVKNDQKGMVAIVTTMILITVISLIVLGFSQVARRNQQQALDSQLSSQAFYAAESGVNLAKAALKADSTYTKDDCDGKPPITDSDYQVSGTNVAVTCLLVNPVNNLVFDPVGATSKVSLIQPVAGNINAIYINWESTTDGNITNCNNGPVTSLPPTTGWATLCNQPLLRVDLVPMSNGSLNSVSLRAEQFTAFLYPDVNGSTAVPWVTSTGTNGKGNIIRTKCSNTVLDDKVHKCMIRVDLPGNPGRYGIRMMSLYGDSRVEIHVKDSSGNQPNLAGAQVQVDSTAKAIDVLKRVQARISILNNTVVPDFAIMSDDLCKRYSVDPSSPSVTVDGGNESNACRP